MWCSQCETDKPPEQFLKVKRGWRVEYCDRCAQENMRRYWRKVETDPDKVRRRGVEK